jgi:hypothetical protein
MRHLGKGLRDGRQVDGTPQICNRDALEQNLATMLRLKSKCLEFSVSLLISELALGVFLLLQFEDLLEWGLGDGSGDIVLAVKVLHNCRLAWIFRAM